MYNEYFGFKEAPFSIAPDPRYLYMTAQHREALAHLVYGLNSEGGCILLTGEVGTGKTTICRCLLDQLPEQANVALVLNPKVSEIELLETICDELKISYPDAENSVKTYTDRIYQHLIESHRKNEKIVLIIDEAQNLDSTVLEQLRLLTNLETNQRKLLQIIILGQPELLDILAKTEMRQLAQRITARFHLQPLSRHEVKAYVSHRLAVAGQNIQLFPENSIKRLYKLSNGIPRLINIICDRALLGAYVENQYAVNPLIIKKAATEVFGELKNVEKLQSKNPWFYPIAAVSSVAIIAIAAFFYLANSGNSKAEQTQARLLSETQITPSASASDSDIETHSVISAQSATAEQSRQQNTAETLIAASTPTAQTLATQTPVTQTIDNTAAQQDENISESEIHTAYDNIEDILNDTANNQLTAYQKLFNTWNKQYNHKSKITACKQAEAYSLRCLYKQGNLNSLKVYNRPAVLTLINGQGKTRYVTVTSIANDAASLYANNKPYLIKLTELDKYWYGQFILLWQKPDFYSSAITPGNSGQIINWLNHRLSLINNTNPADDLVNRYDDYLVEKVKNFQSKHGLMADGIVGPVTIIHLNSQSGQQIPSLTPLAVPQPTQQG